MIGKQNRDTLCFCYIYEDSAVSDFVYKKTKLRGGGEGSVQKHTGAYRRGRVMECEYIRSLTIFSSVNFFSLGSMQILQTLEVKIYTNRFQDLYHSCIRLQVFIFLYQSNSGL